LCDGASRRAVWKRVRDFIAVPYSTDRWLR
jgi:hypothetical protein